MDIAREPFQYSPMVKFLALLFVLAACVLCTSCTVVEHVGIALLYKPAPLPAAQVTYDIPYAGPNSSAKQCLDLFVPTGTNWPFFIFVHGGNWDAGDKSLRVGGADVYRNIGRFYAARGIGVAVINYRLQSTVNWREQVNDVAAATAWIHRHVAEYGGNAGRLFLGGHSAGAQLACHVALDPKPLAAHGLSPAIIRGVISVSGAGLDIADQKTYDLGAKRSYYTTRFGNSDPPEIWQPEASPVTYVSSNAPAFLILYAAGESKALQRQSQRLSEILEREHVPHRVVVVPGQSHARMVLTLSRSDQTSADAILDFIRETAADARDTGSTTYTSPYTSPPARHPCPLSPGNESYSNRTSSISGSTR
jgi:acetyl esterase/lipase